MQFSLITPVVSLFFVAIALVTLVLVVIRAQHREYLHYFFVLFMVASAVWATGLGAFLLTRSPEMAYGFAVIYYIAAAIIVYALLLLVLSIPARRQNSEKELSIGRLAIVLTLPIITMIVIAIIPKGLIKSVNIAMQNTAVLQPYAYDIYTFIFLTYSAISSFLLFYKLYNANEPRYKRQLLYIAGSALFGIGFGSFFDLILPLLGNYYLIWVGPLCGIPVVLTVFYSIIRHGLFDIRRVVIRTVTYILSIITLAGIYYLIVFTISELFVRQSGSVGQNIISAAIAIILAFAFQPIKKFFDRLTNRVFYRDNYDSDEFFAKLNRILTLTTDLHGLLHQSANEIAMTLKVEQAFFVVKRQNKEPILTGTDHHRLMPILDIKKIDDYVEKGNIEIIILGLLLPNESEEDIRRLMLSHRLELILPLVLSGKIIGYLCLGDQKSSKYTQRDVNVLTTASDEITIAIQDALAVQEIREFNTTLQQRIANATKELRTSNAMLRRLDKAKDEFVSMASHQLRTPLTSVKGYISMVLEGDAGKVSESQRQLLDQAFNSSERMVRLIDDFLNVSRIQNGKFIIDKHPIDLSKIVTQELDSLQSNALAHKTKFIYNAPKDFPIINIDEGKIRQVIMNFADNALYYSNDNSSVEITLTTEGENAILKVKDSGIGVPRDEQAELFTKFYRASNARRQRPDGTGVGLYLAKRIITAHGGKMIFESIQDKGSTFGFSMPLKQD
jgi:signal transduction histidine kinase